MKSQSNLPYNKSISVALFLGKKLLLMNKGWKRCILCKILVQSDIILQSQSIMSLYCSYSSSKILHPFVKHWISKVAYLLSFLKWFPYCFLCVLFLAKVNLEILSSFLMPLPPPPDWVLPKATFHPCRFSTLQYLLWLLLALW